MQPDGAHKTSGEQLTTGASMVWLKARRCGGKKENLKKEEKRTVYRMLTARGLEEER